MPWWMYFINPAMLAQRVGDWIAGGLVGLVLWIKGKQARCRSCNRAVGRQEFGAFTRSGCPECGGLKLEAYYARDASSSDAVQCSE